MTQPRMQDAEFQSADATCEPAQKLTTAKRRRAAEVHNLSERVSLGPFQELPFRSPVTVSTIAHWFLI